MDTITSKHVGAVAAPDFFVGGEDHSVKLATQVIVTLEQYGAVGDGVTDDTAAVMAAIAAAGGGVITGVPGKQYKVSSSYVDPKGARFDSRNVHIINRYGYLDNPLSMDDPIFGMEQMYSWQYAHLYDRGSPLSVLFSGDSTTLGGAGSPQMDIVNYVGNMARIDGFDNVTFINAAHNGITWADWRNTYLAVDMAVTPRPKVFVLRYGVNDISTTGMDDIATNMREGLKTLTETVGFRYVDGFSIVLMTPNSTHGTGRDYLKLQQISDMYRRAAYDFKCVFIDTYRLVQNSRHSAGRWMDTIMVHPRETFNGLMADHIYNVLFPYHLRQKRQITSSTYKPGSILPRDVSLYVPVGAQFYLSGISRNPEYNAAGNYLESVTSGTITLPGTTVTLAPSSYIGYGIDNTVDGVTTMCIRFKVTPTFTSITTDNTLFFLGSRPRYDSGSTQDFLWMDAIYCKWLQAGNVRLIGRADAGVTDVTLGEWAVGVPVTGTEYDMEFNIDISTGSSTIHVNGAQIGAASATTIGRTKPAMLFVLGGYNTALNTNFTTLSFRDVTIFKAKQHAPASSFSVSAGALPITTVSRTGLKIGDSSIVLDNYKSAAISTTTASITGSPALTGTVLRTGFAVNFILNQLQGSMAGATPIVVTGAIPVGFRPSSDQYFTIRMMENGAAVFGLALVASATGTITFYKDAALGNFTSGANAGPYATTLPWQCA